MTDSVGRTILHYKILEKLGEGGMGVVYRAEDTKLHRNVAIKFLPPHIANNSEERQRFKIEAQAAAALNHPNITTIYAIEEVDDEIFIVMEYICGQELKNIISKSQLELEEAVRITTQIAEGLNAAHKKEIVHRDIKTANIMINDENQVKIMDFGLAKMGNGIQLTKEHSTLGTAPYMSPEQARGDEINRQTDIWSLGVVFYELLTGQLPFKGEYEQAVIYSILNENYESIVDVRNDAPNLIDGIINKCLSKKLDERYQNINDLILDLENIKDGKKAKVSLNKRKYGWVNYIKYLPIALILICVTYYVFHFITKQVSQKTPAKKMIVVLPFQNFGSEEDIYFADGMTDAIIARLGMIDKLGVISRQSSIQFKNSDKTVQQIGDQLKVDFVLGGSVQKDTKSDTLIQIRIIPNLSQVTDGTSIWTEILNVKLNDIFQVQMDVAEKVAQALDIHLLEPERKLLRERSTENIEAYENVLRGNEYLYRGFEEQEINIAIEMYEKAIHLDSSYALAYAMLSKAHFTMYNEYHDRSQARLNSAKEVTDIALRLNPELTEALHSMSQYYSFQGDLEKSLEYFDNALKNEPTNSEILAGFAYILRKRGRVDEAIRKLKVAIEFDPLDHMKIYELAMTQLVYHNYSESEQNFNKVISMRPDWYVPYIYKTILYMSWEGSYSRANNVMKDAAEKIGMHELVKKLMFVGAGDLFDILDENFNSIMANLSLEASGADSSTYYLMKAGLYNRRNRPETSFTYFDSARVILERLVRIEPNEPFFHSDLAIAYAGIEEKGKAESEILTSMKLLPVQEDSWNGPDYVWNAADVYVKIGEYEKAMDQIELVFSYPSFMSKAWLQADKSWDPLWNNSRFQKIMKNK